MSREIFAIVAFATTANYTNNVHSICIDGQTRTIEYPYSFEFQICNSTTISADLSSDAQFFVATGVLSMMYCIFIIAVYAIIDELYRTKSEFPLADFFLTTILAIFWLAGSSAWSNGTTALKTVTNPDKLSQQCKNCTYTVESFSKLNISLLIGFLNFFLWASGLWFLYKETIWFQGRQAKQQNVGAGTSTMGQQNV
ncbi:synaptoporin-like isoform X2 [Condylostylus longicornis]|uniref:synaptoporin-like isoform X2 n=1 Tax=Condylostylus longicornis TaxID=2530218 RepID=UPI00244DAA1B|nr:synaptoporin-like isoform X2 [Condylostylus longicornis]XP_055383903.1 synaptoporin-like isoform X2 [Condylostylus longicornis]